ncbi:MAG: hypothetical protein QM539_10880 [Alphaproteobacteria bacterium]|nr:hypothetical protein [Alphaproteobacteria bacterium]
MIEVEGGGQFWNYLKQSVSVLIAWNEHCLNYAGREFMNGMTDALNAK